MADERLTRVFKNFNAGSYSFGIDLRLRTVRTLVLQFLLLPNEHRWR